MEHYLDNAATTPLLPASIQAVTEALEAYGNPSSRHRLGDQARESLARHRAVLAGALGAQPEEIVFTSGGTEGSNWAVAAGVQLGRRQGKHIITTAIEHAAVLEPIKMLAQQGYEVTYLPCDKTGHVAAASLAAALRPDTVLLSMMLVNNELGTVQPVAECAALARAVNPNIFLHCDGVQGFLKMPFTAPALGVDMLTFSAHKIGGPKGVGGAYLRRGIKTPPFLLGGGQECGLRSGTESTALVAGFAAAVAHHQSHLPQAWADMAALKDYAVETLTATLGDLKIITMGDAPHILAFSLPGYKSEVVVRFLSDKGIYLSSGSACHKGKPSHVYAALGLSKAWLDGALRISFSPATTAGDIDALAAALTEARALLFTTLS